MSRGPTDTETAASAASTRPLPTIDDGAMPSVIDDVRLLDPLTKTDAPATVVIHHGEVRSLERGKPPANARHMNGHGLWLMPGIIDLCARLREPGATDKASMSSESPAAVAGGITTLCLPPDTGPIIDSPAMVARINKIADSANGARVLMLGALTRALGGTALAEMSALKQAGCVGVSNAGHALADLRTARRALEYATGLGLTVHVQPQDAELAADGCAHDGAIACRLGLTPIPVAAETVALRQWISLAEDTDARIHFGRLSSARGVALVAAAKARGVTISADVAAHQLFLDEEDVEGFDPQCHVLPPLRSKADRAALRTGLANGTIDALCSDHQPHEADAKINPFPMTEPGMSALDTFLVLGLRLVSEGVLTPLQLTQRLSLSPADILGFNTQTVARDWILVDPQASWRLDAGSIRSRGRNTPFMNREFHGLVRQVFRHDKRGATG